jgi:quercetin dioxygenase-like cupin family protein
MNRAAKSAASKAAKTLAASRRMVNFKAAKFEVYSLQGRPQDDLAWHNLSYDDKSGQGFFLIRFKAGGQSIPHEHLGFEEFVVLKGELEESDGTVYRVGDCVSLAPGSRHVTASSKGAIVAVFVRGGFRTLNGREKVDE